MDSISISCRSLEGVAESGPLREVHLSRRKWPMTSQLEWALLFFQLPNVNLPCRKHSSKTRHMPRSKRDTPPSAVFAVVSARDARAAQLNMTVQGGADRMLASERGPAACRRGTWSGDQLGARGGSHVNDQILPQLIPFTQDGWCWATG